MQNSRYARLNLLGRAQPITSPINEEPLQFSNSVDDSYNVLSSPDPINNGNTTSKKQRSRIRNRSIPSTGDRLAYTGLDLNTGPQPPKRRRTNSSLYKAASSIRDFAISHFTVPSVAAPWEHEVSEKHGAGLPPSDSVRFFDYRRQRRRLFVNSTFQWFTTAFICACLASALYGFSTVVTGLSATRKAVFNALVTGLSLCLGLNLASSLRGYAQLMRWRFLASGYRTIQDFELVMNCDSQSKVFRLIWAGRTRGHRLPNKTQVLAVVWLLINVALQVFTALLGLTYSTDVSTEYVTLDWGNVSVADVSYIGTYDSSYVNSENHTSMNAKLAELGTANELGITGQDFSWYNTSFDSYFANQQSIYTDGNFFWYRFIDRAPLAFQITTASYRTVNTTATCESHPVVYGGYAGFQTDNASIIWDVTWTDSDGVNHTWWIPDQAQGATTWMSNLTSDCGPRCTQIYALQVADNSTDDVFKPRFWECFSNVSLVDGVDLYPDSDLYQIHDQEALALSGAIGSNAFVQQGDNGSMFTTPEMQLQYNMYPADSQWSPGDWYEAADMAWLVMKFSAGAISALDDIGPRRNLTGWTPAPAQVITVRWTYAASILGGIPFAQFLILLAVIMFANKAIIKDTSHLSTARLLRPLVDKLGDKGCLLTGDEIAEQLGNYKIIYGIREPNTGLGGGMNGIGVIGGQDGKIRHLDILEETEGLGYRRGRMPEGKYDGLQDIKRDEIQPLLGLESDDTSEDDDFVLNDSVRRRRTPTRARRRSI